MERLGLALFALLVLSGCSKMTSDSESDPQVVENPTSDTAPAPIEKLKFDFSVFNYNIKGLPTLIDGNSQIDDIVDEMLARIDAGTAPDVLLFEEAFTGDSIDEVRRLISDEYPYYEYGPEADGTVYGSGLIIISRYPILESNAIEFGGNCAEFDCFANKGIHYIKVDLPKSPADLEIYHTHMQAFRDNDDVRMQQIVQFREIFDENHSNENAVVFAGDFNFKPDRESFHVFQEAFPEMMNVGAYCLVEEGCATDDSNPQQDYLESTLDHQYLNYGQLQGAEIAPMTLVRSYSEEFDGLELSDHLGYEVVYRIQY